MDKNHELSSLENVEVLHFLKLHFSDLKNHSLFIQNIKKQYFLTQFLQKKKQLRKISIFGQKPWIIPLRKWPFFLPFKTFVFGSKLYSFLYRIPRNDLFEHNYFENIRKHALIRKSLNFGQKPWTNLLAKDRVFLRSKERCLSGLKIILF